ncbi:hypothetical protein EDD21DRAFT_356598 [Dissophora ornata]|nr:hypothetical protein EDD21DRAFT_356598 [Dissophora ornata]
MAMHQRTEYEHSDTDTSFAHLSPLPPKSPLNTTNTHESNASTLPAPPSHPANSTTLPGNTVRYHRHADATTSNGTNLSSFTTVGCSSRGVNSRSTVPTHKRVQNATCVTPSSWTLPAIPSFAELNMKLDRSSAGSFKRTSLYLPGTAGTSDALLTNADSTRINPGEHEHHWSAQADSDGPAPIELDMVPSYAPSIFDKVQPDDNESYIIWSSPPAPSSSKPSTSTVIAPPPRSVVTASAEISAATTSSTETKTAVVLPLPMPSLAHSTPAQSPSGVSVLASASLHPALPLPPVAAVNQSPSSVAQDRSLLRCWSGGEVFKGKDNDGVDCFPPSKQIPKDDMGAQGTGAGTTNFASHSAKKSVTSPSATLGEENRVIMAATVEKLVEKLTSEIGNV